MTLGLKNGDPRLALNNITTARRWVEEGGGGYPSAGPVFIFYFSDFRMFLFCNFIFLCLILSFYDGSIFLFSHSFICPHFFFPPILSFSCCFFFFFVKFYFSTGFILGFFFLTVLVYIFYIFLSFSSSYFLHFRFFLLKYFLFS